jgi:hypothetical protein
MCTNKIHAEDLIFLGHDDMSFDECCQMFQRIKVPLSPGSSSPRIHTLEKYSVLYR